MNTHKFLSGPHIYTNMQTAIKLQTSNPKK